MFFDVFLCRREPVNHMFSDNGTWSGENSSKVHKRVKLTDTRFPAETRHSMDVHAAYHDLNGGRGGECGSVR